MVFMRGAGAPAQTSARKHESRFTCLDVVKAAGLREGPLVGQERSFACNQHDDEHPSLMVNDSKNTWMCGPCRKGGTPWQLAAFLAGLDPSNKSGVCSWLSQCGLETSGNGQRKVAATYPYHDETGTLLFEVVRFIPKGFAQRRPDGTWKLDVMQRRVLYRLPELLTATEVFVVEGEKDADALNAVGLIATTNPGGAGKWRHEYTSVFGRHHRVTIIPDNDEAGREHAIEVASALNDKVGSLKVLQLPGLPPKGDVSDWLAGRDPDGAAEELSRLAEAAPEWSSDVASVTEPTEPRQVQSEGADEHYEPEELQARPTRYSDDALADEFSSRCLSMPIS
jgi:hypothetical protein